jgi:hypothetical protein
MGDLFVYNVTAGAPRWIWMSGIRDEPYYPDFTYVYLPPLFLHPCILLTPINLNTVPINNPQHHQHARAPCRSVHVDR